MSSPVKPATTLPDSPRVHGDKPRARLVGGGKPQWQPRIGCIQAALVRNNHEAVGQPHHRFGRAKYEIAVPGDGLCKPLEEIDLRLLIEIDEHVAAEDHI